MNIVGKKATVASCAIAVMAMFGASPVLAGEASLQDGYQELKKTVDELTEKLNALQADLAEAEAKADAAAQQAAQVKPTQRELANAAAGDSAYHLAGYTDAGYYANEGEDGSFATGHFAPIFHYQYKDVALLEGELAFGLEDGPEGSVTETEVEYLAIDLFLNDYATLVAGKFLSPVGYFVQNLHPSWINKLPSMPIGFAGGHGGSGAAPTAEVGAQIRGGVPAGNGKLNYSVFVGNGPAILAEEVNGEHEIMGLDTSGRMASGGNYATGGRLGWLPFPNLEIGASLGVARAGLAAGGGHAEVAPEPTPTEEPEISDRDYLVYGFDFYYTPQAFKELTFRGEYIRTELGEGGIDEADPEEKVWEAWYLQASYFVQDYKLEPVLRYGQFNDPHGERLTQMALGLNYRFASNVIAKFAYELNDSNDEHGADNRYAIQLAYGF